MIKEMIVGCIKVIKKEFREEFPKTVGHCRHCGRPIFNDKSEWFKRNECVFCYSAYIEGLKKQKEGEMK